MADGKYRLSHDVQDIDDTIDEVQAARGSEASLSARLADIVRSIAAIYRFGTVIPASSDLNDYKTPGVYRIESGSVATTISNLPTGAAAGRLEVKGLHVADRYLQIYFSGDVFFQRRWTGSSWTTWYKFEGTAVQSGGASTQSVQPALMSAAKAETQEQREEETDA